MSKSLARSLTKKLKSPFSQSQKSSPPSFSDSNQTTPTSSIPSTPDSADAEFFKEFQRTDSKSSNDSKRSSVASSIYDMGYGSGVFTVNLEKALEDAVFDRDEYALEKKGLYKATVHEYMAIIASH